MRVLTFNSHQPYLHLLASTLSWSFGAIAPRLPSGRVKSWDLRIRPLPDNVKLYSSLQGALEDSAWDWILTHNVSDVLDCKNVDLPKVFLVHGTLSGRILQDHSDLDRDHYIRSLRVLLESTGCRVVYISNLKRKDWNIPGDVIRPGVDTRQYGGYGGERRAILQVSNNFRERGAMLGWDIHESVCRGLPTTVLGMNRGLAGSRVAESWEDLKEQYRSHRVYLYSCVHPYEDGYNLALLEAMATGTPIGTFENPSSPVEDGVDGVVGSTVAELREKVIWLLDHPQEAGELGNAGRRKVERLFPIDSFRGCWNELACRLRSL